MNSLRSPATTNSSATSTPEERKVIEGCHYPVAHTFADLIKVKTRWSYGAMGYTAPIC